MGKTKWEETRLANTLQATDSAVAWYDRISTWIDDHPGVTRTLTFALTSALSAVLKWWKDLPWALAGPMAVLILAALLVLVEWIRLRRARRDRERERQSAMEVKAIAATQDAGVAGVNAHIEEKRQFARQVEELKQENGGLRAHIEKLQHDNARQEQALADGAKLQQDTIVWLVDRIQEAMLARQTINDLVVILTDLPAEIRGLLALPSETNLDADLAGLEGKVEQAQERLARYQNEAYLRALADLGANGLPVFDKATQDLLGLKQHPLALQMASPTPMPPGPEAVRGTPLAFRDETGQTVRSDQARHVVCQNPSGCGWSYLAEAIGERPGSREIGVPCPKCEYVNAVSNL